MRRARWFVPILPILLLGGLGGGAPASEEGAGVAAAKPDAGASQSAPLKEELPAPTAGQPEAAGVATGVQSESPSTAESEPAAAEPQPTAPEQGSQAGAAAQILVPSPPPSLQTLVDERRDMLRKRREAMLDAYGGRHAYMPPWLVGYDNAVEQYREAMRRLYREQRDYSRMRHNSWMDAMCPWSKPQRDWSERRSYQTQMDQLDRREYWDSYLYGRPFPAYGTIPW